LLLSVHDKKSAVQTTRGIRSDSAFRDTLHLHNVQIKTAIPHTEVMVLSQNLSLLALLLGRCQDVCHFFHICYTEIDEQDAKTTCFYALWDSGTSIHAVLKSASFPSSRKGKIDREPPVSMNSELTEKSKRYKTDENNYKPTKSQRYLCL